MFMHMKIDKIELDDLSVGLYGVHLDRKNHRICRVLRALMLRDDFVSFLQKLENEGTHLEEMKRSDGLAIKLWQPKFSVADQMIDEYLSNVIQSDYFEDFDEDQINSFVEIASTMIFQSHLDGYVNQRNTNTIFHNIVMIDDALNYPNIRQRVFDKELFWKVFDDAFYYNSEAIKEKYGGHPSSIVIGGNKFDDIPNNENETPTAPKVCQLVFDDTTEKQELLDYIDKNWSAIEESLKAWRPSRQEKRITSAGNFIRDVHIFNKHQTFKREGFKNPDVKVYSWLKDESEYKVEIEPNTIRKIVSLMRTDLESINTNTEEK